MDSFVPALINAGVAYVVSGFNPYAAAAAFGSTLVLTAVAQHLAKPAGGGAGGQLQQTGAMQTVRQPIAPWEVVWGRVRKGGILTFRWITYDKRQWHIVITLAGHRCQAVDAMFFDNEVVPLDANGNATGRFAGYVRVKYSLGDEASTVQPFPDLVAESGGVWSNDHKQYGHTKAYVRLVWSAELFPTGIPNITFVMRGALAYDPRTAATAYTENPALLLSHYLTESSYGIAATYADEIHEDDLIAAANSCDERVLRAGYSAQMTASADDDVITCDHRCYVTGTGVRFTNTGGGLPAGLAAATTYYAMPLADGTLKVASSYANALTGTAIDITSEGTGVHTLVQYDEPRFAAGGTFSTAQAPRDIVTRLLAAFAGTLVNQGETWRVNAGVYHAPSVTLTERDLVGSSMITAHAAAQESANGVKGVFTNPLAHWQPDDFEPVSSATYLTEDGEERRWKDIDVSPFVQSHTQARRLAKIDLLRMRQSLSERASFRLAAWSAVPGRSVARTDAQLGWSAKAFEVLDSELAIVQGGDGNVVMVVNDVLRETAAAVYDWDTSEEVEQDLAPNTSLPDMGEVGEPGVPAITEAVYETRDGRGVAAKAIVTYAASSYPFGARYELAYKLTSSSTYTPLPLVTGAVGSTEIGQEVLDIAPGRYDFRIQAIGITGARSDYVYALNKEIVGLGDIPADPVIRGLQAAGDGTSCILTLEPHPALDVRIGGRWRIRHTDGDSPFWDQSLSIGDAEGYAGAQTIIALPLKPGTYLVKAEDAIGQLSDGFASLYVKQASVLTFTPVTTLTESPDFSGAKSGLVAVDGVLKLDGAGLVDDIPDFDSISSLDDYGGVEAAGTYTFSSAFNFGAVSNVRITSLIIGDGINVNDLIDDRSGSIDDWEDFDGNAGAGLASDAWVEVRETDDNPAGAPVWSDWKRLDAAAFSCWGVQLRLRMISSDAAYNRHITVLKAKADSI